MKKEFIHLHLHTPSSNLQVTDCVTPLERYITRAKELGMKGFAITDHGNANNWVSKHEAMEEAGLKYIFGIEFYLTFDKSLKVRNAYHLVALAKNTEGRKEILKLMSKSHNRNDGSFYFAPRIEFSDLENSSDNIIFTTACLASPLWKGELITDKDTGATVDVRTPYLNWIIENKHKVFLEVQPHDNVEQIEYNKLLHGWSKEHGLTLVGANDVHGAYQDDLVARKVYKKSKRGKTEEYGDEDDFEIWMKSYDEMFDSFKRQNIFTDEEIHKLLNQTVKIADNIDEYEIDRLIKYPRIFENSMKLFKEKVYKGIEKRGLRNNPDWDTKYLPRINEESKALKKLDMIDFMLLQSSISDFAIENDMPIPPGRGSAAGSLIAYLLYIVDVDPVEHDLLFERFANVDRVSLGDVDTDWGGDNQAKIQQWLLNRNDIQSAPIITQGILQPKSAFDAIGRAYDINPNEMKRVKNTFDEKDKYTNATKQYQEKYPELFKYAEAIQGAQSGCGRHAAGIIVLDHSIDMEKEVGIVSLKSPDGTIHMVSCLDKNEIEGINITKFDILGVTSIAIIEEACRLIGITVEEMKQRMDLDDEDVWMDIRRDSFGIFQAGSPAFHTILKDLFSDTTLLKIREKFPSIRYIDLMSVCNALVRPGAASFRNDFSQGKVYDHKFEELNDFLAGTLGYMPYQEDCMKVLAKFAGYSPSQSDSVRRIMAKKKAPEVMEKELVKIRASFKKHLHEAFGLTEKRAEEIAMPLVQTIHDSQRYNFNKSHSIAYSYIGFYTAWLRYYYPLEFISAILTYEDNKEKKAEAVKWLDSRGLKIVAPIFGSSGIGFEPDNKKGLIYRGVNEINKLGDAAAIYLKEKQHKSYADFYEFMLDLYDPELYAAQKGIECEEVPAKKAITTPQLEVLIDIGFFDCFPGDKKACVHAFAKGGDGFGAYDKKQGEKTKLKKLENIKKLLDNEVKFSPRARLAAEFAALDAPYYVDASLPAELLLISGIVQVGWKVSHEAYQPKTGNKIRVKSSDQLGFKFTPGMFIRAKQLRKETDEIGIYYRVLSGDEL